MPASPPGGVRAEPASFRDPVSRVFHDGDQILRGLRGQAAADYEALAATRFFADLVASGKLCATEVAAGVDPARLGADWSLVLRHERIPFLSYPYEWTFSMLKDAALLHLDVLAAALGEGMTLKDGSAYNLQWHGTAPQFIDIGSFERARDGEPWAGYRQFCQTFLYPLLLQAHLGVGFQPWLRAQIDGIEAAQMRRLLGGGKRFKAGVLKHVHLHAAMEARHAGATTQSTRKELRSAGFNRELVLATVRALRKLVAGLSWRPEASHWVDYQGTCTYSEADRGAKVAFVRQALAGWGRLGLVADVGANDGTYSLLAAEHADYVVAAEFDEAVTDRLYQRLRDERERRILPLVVDLANPSPGIGWRNTERAPFLERVSGADAVLCLALLHHLAIGRNVPLAELLDWLAGLGKRVVVEFVDPEDPMAARLLANKPEGLFPDYRRDVFDKLIAERFTIERREELPSGTRVLYAAVPSA
jgi:SAM-dependent methyltransferase